LNVEAASIFGARRPGIGTLRLAPGGHDSPRDGVCVVELASVLAGERFSDRPDCVDHVIGGYLRSFNDRASHAERQRLLPYAERAVGSCGDRKATHLRRDLCVLRAGGKPGAGGLRKLFERLEMRVRIWVAVGGRQALRFNDGIGEYAARVVYARHGAEEAIRLLDVLFEVGESEAAALAHAVDRAPQARVSASIPELAGHAPAAQGKNGHQPGHDHGNGKNLGRRDARDRHKEDIEHEHSENGDPERGAERSEDSHDLVSVP
jgi:hypothetical protein